MLKKQLNKLKNLPLQVMGNLKNNLFKILVIEDNEDHLYFIKKALSSKDYTIKIIEDGEKAYQYLKNPQIKPNLVILDMFLPNKTGVEILKKLKNLNILYPIIFMSVDNETDVVKAAKDYGVIDYLTKDGDFLNLLEKKVAHYFNQEAFNH
jgi:CheY-like chemotaxis protein